MKDHQKYIKLTSDVSFPSYGRQYGSDEINYQQMIKNMRLDQKTHKEEISAAYTWFFKLPKLRRKESTKPGVEKVVADSLSKYRPSETNDFTSTLEI